MQQPHAEPKRTVGAAQPYARYTRLVETLYKTRIPETTAWADHFFELTLGEETVAGKRGYFVREIQCRWDAIAKHTVRVQYTLSPHGGFATIEEAHERFKQQRTVRAQRGFIHSYTPNYEAVSRHRKYVKIEFALESTTESKASPEAKTESTKI